MTPVVPDRTKFGLQVVVELDPLVAAEYLVPVQTVFPCPSIVWTGVTPEPKPAVGSAGKVKGGLSPTVPPPVATLVSTTTAAGGAGVLALPPFQVMVPVTAPPSEAVILQLPACPLVAEAYWVTVPVVLPGSPGLGLVVGVKLAPLMVPPVHWTT